MKILALDIETSPNVVYTWGFWNQNVGLNQVISTTEILCFAAKWLGAPKRDMEFYRRDRDDMIEQAWRLLDEADVVLHYNGTSFDIPHLNREFIEAGMTPPSPYQQIDLYLAAKKRFRFQSNRLEHVSRQLGLEGKVSHEGFELWTACLAGDEKAWRKMEKYNRRDVELLEELYEILRPWLPSHPSVLVHDGGAGCPRCGSGRLQWRGTAKTKVSEFRRFQCLDCGSWGRATKKVRGVGHTDIAA